MENASNTPLDQNQLLKKSFENLNLKVDEVVDLYPELPELENHRLLTLLLFVRKYLRYGSREALEDAEGGYCFPPIEPAISPESDWYRFEQWMQGKPVRLTLAEQMPQPVQFRPSAEISDAEIDAELNRLTSAIRSAGFGIALLNTGIPSRLLYQFLLKKLDNSFELDAPGNSSGGWTIDGCTGNCPECFRRPWCDIGQVTCWTEDKNAGKIHFTEELSDFISASPQSLAILEKCEAAYEALGNKYASENLDDPDGFNWDDYVGGNDESGMSEN